MGKIDLEIFEDKFLKKYTAQYELSILLGVDSLCFAVSDSASNLLGLRKYSYALAPGSFRELPEAAKEIFLEDPLLRKPCAAIRIAVFHPFVALVPKRLYNDGEKKAYLEKLLRLDKDDRLFSEELSFLQAMAVFPLTAPLIQELGVLAPQASIRHLAACLARSFAPLYAAEEPRRIFFNLRDGMAQVFAFDKEELVLLNTYTFFDSNDLAYFLLLICQQLGWPPEATPLFCSGLLVEDSAIFRNLQRFFPLLTFVPAAGSPYATGPRFGRETRKHWFIDLLSIHW